MKSKKGRRKGKRLGFPRFKKRGKCRDSFRFSTGAIGCGHATVTLPRLGAVKTHESTRKLARRIENGTARILSATVSRTAHRWFVSFTVEAERDVPGKHARPGSAVGIDLGVKTLLTGSAATGPDRGRRPQAAEGRDAEAEAGQPGALPPRKGSGTGRSQQRASPGSTPGAGIRTDALQRPRPVSRAATKWS